MEFFSKLVKGSSVSIVSIEGIDQHTLHESFVVCGVEGEAKLAIIRSEKDLIVAGIKPAMETLCTCIKKNFEVQITPVQYTYGLHMLFIDKLVIGLNLYLEKIDCNKPKITMIDQSGSLFKKNGVVNKLQLTQFLYHPIDLLEVVRRLNVVSTIIQVGPGQSTVNVLSKYFPKKETVLIKYKSDMRELL